MYDVISYRVWLEDKNVTLKVKIIGVLTHNINPLLIEVKKMKDDFK